MMWLLSDLTLRMGILVTWFASGDGGDAENLGAIAWVVTVYPYDLA